jgi:hypothetical protein
MKPTADESTTGKHAPLEGDSPLVGSDLGLLCLNTDRSSRLSLETTNPIPLGVRSRNRLDP